MNKYSPTRVTAYEQSQQLSPAQPSPANAFAPSDPTTLRACAVSDVSNSWRPLRPIRLQPPPPPVADLDRSYPAVRAPPRWRSSPPRRSSTGSISGSSSATSPSTRKSPGRYYDRLLFLLAYRRRVLVRPTFLKLARCSVVASDDEALEGLQQELDDCKNDQVSHFATQQTS